METFEKENQHLKIKLEAIMVATNNFEANNIIGTGGFGKVYSGVLIHSMGESVVAMKRLDRGSGQGDAEFWKEVQMLSCYKNENLISLFGYCNDHPEKILVYEHASEGSLYSHLSKSTLKWRRRLEIVLGAAKGLSYLHYPNELHQAVLHRDIKTPNILLDRNWTAKFSDMGLATMIPANDQNKIELPSTVVGTSGYIDPMYKETGIYTRESDVYSFGLVLFEVLCGKLCCVHRDNDVYSFVKTWKECYERSRLDEITFQEIRPEIGQRSLKAYSDIAYRCLRNSRAERPTMCEVVERLNFALQCQDNFEGHDFQRIILTAEPRVDYRSIEELKMLFSKGTLVNKGKTWFSLNKDGEHCELISAAECLTPTFYESPMFPFYGRMKSRFAVDWKKPFCWKFKTKVRTQFLSPNTTYTVNLVFDFSHTSKDYNGISYISIGKTKYTSTTYHVDKREDGWSMAELYQFTSDGNVVDLEIIFSCGCLLEVEGIEFKPLEIMEHVALDDENMDVQSTSQSETYWEKKLPKDYEKIITLSGYSVPSTTKEKIYFILCKGFLVKSTDEWFSLERNGKKCYMLPARLALIRNEWSWQTSPESSRDGEVAFVDPLGSFVINCRSKMLSPQTTYLSPQTTYLSPQITYECYLVYKLQEKYESPVKVNNVLSTAPYHTHTWYIYLTSPQTPNFIPNVDHNIHNPLNRPNKKGLPQKRNDGWMEVQLTEFKANTIDELIFENLRLTLSDKKMHKGLTVKGIEFKTM